MNSRTAQNDWVDDVLSRTPPEELVSTAITLIESYQRDLSVRVGETIASHLVSRLTGAAEISLALQRLKEYDRAMSRFVRARILADRGESAAAIEGFGEALRTAAGSDADVLLHRARLLARENRFTEAIGDLQTALQLFPPYGFFVKSEKLLHRILASGQWQPRRKVKLAVVGSSTTALLAPVLRAAGFRRGMQLDIYEGSYGNYQQEILDSKSGLYAFRPDCVVILLNHRDVALPPAGGHEASLEFSARLVDLWKVLLDRHPCHIVQIGIDSPPAGAWGSLEDTLPEGRRKVLASLNLALTDDCPQGVSLVDANALAAQVGRDYWAASEWHMAKQYPAAAALPLLADSVCAHCAAVLGLSSKVLAVDLDNTLWGGVIGEDWLGGIRVGPPGAEGEGYLELQKYLKELQQRGVLLAVCSKNNLADAELPFRELPCMHLKRDDFVAFVANWEEKAKNLEQIAETLSLGLDSFVFLDDNPMERALVRSQLPQVVVPECGPTPWDMLAALQRGMYFETVAVTAEDVARHSSYRSNAARTAAKARAPSLEAFLGGLEMVACHGAVDASTLPRVTQLINKTNQFNLTTRRYAEDQVRAMAASSDWWCRWFILADRFGDHGLIGVILARKGRPAWHVDTWLMSCRILGRRMEDFMCAVLLTAAQEDGAESVVGQYVPTEKNSLVSGLYAQLGFDPAAEGRQEYVFPLAGRPIPKCAFIRGKADEEDSSQLDSSRTGQT